MTDRASPDTAPVAPDFSGASGHPAASLIGVRSGQEDWLLDLSDSGEIVPLSALTAVPLTRAWFAGIANIRGNLYAVTDFSAFQGKAPTPRNASARFLLIGARYGNNAALLVTRMLGLRKQNDLLPAPPNPDDPPWVEAVYADREGRRWNKLSVRALLEDPRFMDIGL